MMCQSSGYAAFRARIGSICATGGGVLEKPGTAPGRINAGESHVVSWGKGEDGALGQGVAVDLLVPTLVEALQGKRVSAVRCGAEFSVCICKDEREVYSWGW